MVQKMGTAAPIKTIRELIASVIAKFHQDGQQISCKAATEFH
jgi:hypothetical protein